MGNVDKPLMIIIILAADWGERKARGTPSSSHSLSVSNTLSPMLGLCTSLQKEKPRK